MNLPATDQLHNATVIISEGKKKSSEGFLLIGSALSLVKRQGLWKGSYESFAEYCTSVGLSRGYAYKLAQVWDKFGEGAKGIEPDRLLKLLPLKVENEAEVLEQARELNPGAWQAKVHELKGLTPSDGDCKHEGEIHSYCSICRKRVS